jgi:hypothetical protein
MTIITVPKGAPSRISGRDGRIYSTRVSEDKTVVDMMPQDFEYLLSGPDGKSWAKVNPSVAVRLIAPESVTCYSYDGVEFQIGDDHLVVVADHVASVLRSHGFRNAPNP